MVKESIDVKTFYLLGLRLLDILRAPWKAGEVRLVGGVVS